MRTTFTYVNSKNWEYSQDFDEIESWGNGSGEFQFMVLCPERRVIVMFWDNAEGAFEFLRNHKQDGFTEVNAVIREALI